MNIFVLDNDIRKCAQYHCDQHVVKMILESVQILCTALNKIGFITPYQSTHVHHPCVLWVEHSYGNFVWLATLARELNCEYCYRFNKSVPHKSIAVLDEIEQKTYLYEDIGLTDFAQAMPEPYKVPGDVVQAYRNFYIAEKLKFARWTKRHRPDWLQQ
ncbi:pyrimidine dimer DNA glycosylase/endonuclease V [Celerinatantimonas sp. MCCC 1A17872]|uniref:pyrimidine dimer DNA glycosylase/endonuclease V n=1 Tax=Celerinatantimonas sp. MCCC 1A17872 TaxID=3177514 RepID=UPI0038C6AA6F